MEFLAQLPLVELQSCREEIARISLHVGDWARSKSFQV